MNVGHLRGWLVRLFSPLSRSNQEQEFDEELESHLQMHIEDNLRRGLTPDEARRLALIKLGGIEQTKERHRDQRRAPLFETLAQDLRYSARIFARQPGFTLIAVATLALGIGANTAIFSLFNQVLLKRLPVREAHQLVILSSPGERDGHVTSDAPDNGATFSYPMYRDIREHNQVLTGLLAFFPVSLNIALQGQSERASGVLVSGNYFEVLGVRAASGRTLTPYDDVTSGAHPVAVLSHSFWQRRFGSDSTILNNTMLINGQVMTIVGITEESFTGTLLGQAPDIFIPIAMKAQMTPNWDGLTDRKDYWVNIIGRLDSTLSRDESQKRLEPLYRSLLESENPAQPIEVARQLPRLILEDGSRGRQVLQNNTRELLLMLMGTVGLVLLITCANLASMQITRGVARQKELSIRQALGASRGRLIRQLLIENVVLSLTGGLLGLLVAWTTLAGLLQWVPEGKGLAGVSAEVDKSILVFNFALSLMAAVLFGLLPALRSTPTNLTGALKDQGRSVSPGAAHAGLRKGLVIVEVALTMVVLIAAGLLARSLYNLKNADLGLRAEHVHTFSIAPDLNGYGAERSQAFVGRLKESLAALAGVEAVSASELPVFANSDHEVNVIVEGYLPGIDERIKVLRNAIAPEYFSTLGVPVTAGREFNDTDTAQSRKTVIINESLARHYFAGINPLGRRIKFGGPRGISREIVGVVRDSKHTNVRSTVRDFVYVPYTQRGALEQVTFYVLTRQKPEAMAAALREEVARHDANLPTYALRTVGEQIDESIFNDRFLALLSSAFGLLAAILAVIGIYGLMSYTVSQRTYEIGIRLALGAQTGGVLKLIVKQGMLLTFIGIGVGLTVAIALTRLMTSILYRVSETDMLTFLGVSVVLALVGLAACYVPARRAMKVDPITALRSE